MPAKKEILDGLQLIVNKYSVFAVIWHVVFYILLAALIFNWSPSGRYIAILFSLPLLSVALFAWLTGNPFNGMIFSLISVLVLIFGLNAPSEKLSISSLPFVIAGTAMLIFGLIYPHFIKPHNFIKYLYASPAGIIPCPTLSVLIGLMLIYNGLNSTPLMILFILSGLFYGLFGFLKLNVRPDILLILGTIALLLKFLIN